MDGNGIKVTPSELEALSGYKFNVKQNNAIELFARGLTYRQVAEEVGVSQQCLANWNKLPGFKESVELFRTAYTSKRLREFDGKMGQLELDAIETLAEIMKDKEQKIPDRLAAARAILAHQNGRKAQNDNQILVSFNGMPAVGAVENQVIAGEVAGNG